ncbi:hypothetical protein C8F01DRAFT_697068 [Mycena amicta]|nr:hypothetical protein C8F01DRAFT_697068 [Mycena amicta]
MNNFGPNRNRIRRFCYYLVQRPTNIASDSRRKFGRSLVIFTSVRRFLLLTTMTSFFADFPPELLVKIFIHLPYFSLLRLLRVCKLWNTIVTDDPELGVLLFKRMSTSTVPVGLNNAKEPGEEYVTIDMSPASEPVEFHPCFHHATYSVGGNLSRVIFYEPLGILPTEGKHVSLTDTKIADDFITIPVVTMLKLKIPGQFSPDGLSIFSTTVKIKNAKGVRVMDLWKTLVEKFDYSVNLNLPTGNVKMHRGGFLSDFDHYAGFAKVTRNGLALSAELILKG